MGATSEQSDGLDVFEVEIFNHEGEFTGDYQRCLSLEMDGRVECIAVKGNVSTWKWFWE